MQRLAVKNVKDVEDADETEDVDDIEDIDDGEDVEDVEDGEDGEDIADLDELEAELEVDEADEGDEGDADEADADEADVDEADEAEVDEAEVDVADPDDDLAELEVETEAVDDESAPDVEMGDDTGRRMRDLFDSDGRDEAVLSLPNWVAPVFNHRMSKPYLTKYEECQLLGIRAEQLARGAAPCLSSIDSTLAPLDIARAELQAHRLPFTLRRTFPNGHVESFSLDKLQT